MATRNKQIDVIQNLARQEGRRQLPADVWLEQQDRMEAVTDAGAVTGEDGLADRSRFSRPASRSKAAEAPGAKASRDGPRQPPVERHA